SDAPPVVQPGAVAYAYDLSLRRPDGTAIPVQVAVALVQVNAGTVSWTSDDFHVPESLWGTGSAGIANRFMVALLGTLRTSGATRCEVCVQMPEDRRDDAALTDRVDFVEFYKRNGFRLQPPGTDDRRPEGDTNAVLVLPLRP